MNLDRAKWLSLLAMVLAQPSYAQLSVGLAPAEGVDGLSAQVGKRFSFVCPASDGTRASVYGTDVYTTSSAVCAAAIHAGVLKPGAVGPVSIVIGTGAESFPSSTRNGVTTRSYGRWGRSYTFARDAGAGLINWRTVWNGVPMDFTQPVALECPAGDARNSVLWGTDVYTKDSSICGAAAHVGAIKAETGGVVIVQRVAGLPQYRATTRYGIASRQYGPYADAFTVAAGGRTNASTPARAGSPQTAIAPAPIMAPTVSSSTAVVGPGATAAAEIRPNAPTADAGAQTAGATSSGEAAASTRPLGPAPVTVAPSLTLTAPPVSSMSWMRGTWAGTTTNSGSLYFEKVDINSPNIRLNPGSSISLGPNPPATGRYVARLSLGGCAGTSIVNSSVELTLAQQRAAQPFTNLKTWTNQANASSNTPAVFEHVVDLVAGTPTSSASDDLRWLLTRGTCSFEGLTLTAQ